MEMCIWPLYFSLLSNRLTETDFESRFTEAITEHLLARLPSHLSHQKQAAVGLNCMYPLANRLHNFNRRFMP